MARRSAAALQPQRSQGGEQFRVRDYCPHCPPGDPDCALGLCRGHWERAVVVEHVGGESKAVRPEPVWTTDQQFDQRYDAMRAAWVQCRRDAHLAACERLAGEQSRVRRALTGHSVFRVVRAVGRVDPGHALSGEERAPRRDRRPQDGYQPEVE